MEQNRENQPQGPSKKHFEHKWIDDLNLKLNRPYLTEYNEHTDCLTRAASFASSFGSCDIVPGTAKLLDEQERWLEKSVQNMNRLTMNANRSTGTPQVARILVQSVYTYTANPAINSALLALNAPDGRSVIYFDDQLQVLPKGTFASMLISNQRASTDVPIASSPVFGSKAAKVILTNMISEDLPQDQTWPPHRGYGDYVARQAISKIMQSKLDNLGEIHFQQVKPGTSSNPPPDKVLATPFHIMTNRGEFYVLLTFDKFGRIQHLFS